jgi:hypothetical protein
MRDPFEEAYERDPSSQIPRESGKNQLEKLPEPVDCFFEKLSAP